MRPVNKLMYKQRLIVSLFWWLLVGLILGFMASMKYVALHTALMDFGIFLFHFRNIEQGEWAWALSFGHIQPFNLFYSFIYSQLPVNFAPQIVLIIQGLLLASPIYWLRQQYGSVVMIAYILYFPLWFIALFDFHIDHLSIVFIMFFFILVKNHKGLAIVSAIALALVKEPFALQTTMCGVYILGVHWRNSHNIISKDLFSFENIKIYLYSIGLIVFGLFYFYIAIDNLLPLASGDKSVAYSSAAFSWMGTSISEIVRYIITHPIDIFLEIISNSNKVIYLVAIFGSLGFIPLLKPGPLIVALPILAIALLSRHEGYYGLGHHYTAGLIAPIIFAFIGGLPRAEMIWQRVGFSVKWFYALLVIVLLAAHIALSPSPISRLFWSDKIWSYNYKAYIPADRDLMIKQAIVDYIPTEPDITISIQNTLNWAPLVQRRHFLLFPEGVVKGQQVPFFSKSLWASEVEWRTIMADYVVLDMKRPWFLIDKGCDWLYGKCTNVRMTNEYLEWVEKTKSIMQVVFERDGFIILKRKNNGE